MQVFPLFFPVVRPSILSLSELILRFSILANLMSRIEIFPKFGLYFRFFPTVDPLLFFALWFFWLKSPLFRDRTSEKFKYFKENIKSCIRKIQNIFLILVSGIKDCTLYLGIYNIALQILPSTLCKCTSRLRFLGMKLEFCQFSSSWLCWPKTWRFLPEPITMIWHNFFNDFSTRITVYIQF